MNRSVFSLFIICCLMICGTESSAQAFDWTKQDCNGKTWNLFSQLDSNQVVAMEFGMGCTSCTDAAGFFSNLIKQYQVSYPGRFKALYLDFWGNTCGTTVINSGMHAEFDSCQAELAAYSSALPMTYIVIAAGPSHSVIYSFDKKFLFDFADTIAIKAAIENYLNGVGIKEVDPKNKITSLYPNPAQNKVTITCKDKTTGYTLVLKNIKGQALKEKKYEAKEELTFGIEEFPAGDYFITVKYSSGIEETHKFIKN